MAPAKLHINKMAAAKRQIQAAIRMFFMEEDELAVHTVAAAAYGILKDLKRDRGRSEAADICLTTVFYLVRDFHRGLLPGCATSNPALMAEIKRIADQLPQITADAKPMDLQGSITPSLEREYWNKSNRVVNYLKHADRDADGILPLAVIDNKLLLLKCCLAYRDIAPDDLGSEGLIFESYMAACNPAHQATGSAFDALLELMKSVPDDQRLALCHRTIVEMNENQ